MKLTDFAAKLNEVNGRFQTLAYIRTHMPNLKSPDLDGAQRQAEDAFNELWEQWKEIREGSTTVLDAPFLKN